MSLTETNPTHTVEADAASSRARSVASQDTVQHEDSRSVEPLEVADAAEDESGYPTGRKLWLVAMALGSSLCVIGLRREYEKLTGLTEPQRTIPYSQRPCLQSQTSSRLLQTWVGTTRHSRSHFMALWSAARKTDQTPSSRLTSCAFQFMFGKLYTVYSVKVVFLAALAIFEVGSLLAGLAPTSKVFVLGRAIAGFGSAGVISGTFTLIRLSVPLRRRPIWAGLAAGVEGIAETSAPLLGGIITDSISWRYCFLMNPPIGVFTFVAILVFFEDPTTDRQGHLSLMAKISKLDLTSTVIFVPAICALLLALQWGGNKYGWGNARIVVLFCVCAVLIGLFAWHQRRRGAEATLPLRIVGNRSILAGMSFSFFNTSTVNIVVYYMPIYFQAVKETTASKSGIMILPLIIAQLIGLALGGPIVSAIGYYVPMMLLTSAITPVASGLLTTLKVDASMAQLIIYQSLLGIGNGIGFQAPQVAAQTILPTNDAAMGIACIIFAQHFGPALFVSVAQTIFSERLVADLARYAPDLNKSPEALERMGLTDLKRHLGPKHLKEALLGYDKAVTQTFYLPLTLACLTLIGSSAMEWRSVKKKQH